MNKINISDRNGRAFEYIIVKIISKKNNSAILNESAKNHQNRDREKFNSCPSELQNDFNSASHKVVKWIGEELINPNKIFMVECPSDNDAKKGDVTDIRLIQDKQYFNLSIKSNHEAYKHQRPETVMNQLGYKKETSQDKTYRSALKTIKLDFLKEVVSRRISLFNQFSLEEKNKLLYAPVIRLIHSRYIEFGEKELAAKNLFRFLVGNNDFHKIIRKEKSISITHISADAREVKFFSSELDEKPNYLNLRFSNGLSLRLRLHTASSRITKSVSLKFDTQKTKLR